MIKNLTGLKFGKLTVVEHLIIYKQKRNRQYCNCVCDCGGTKLVDYYQLINGKTESCGCIRKNLITKHNQSRTKFYSIFKGIKQRCNNSKNSVYHNYGGRGIKCLWKSFEEFYKDMFISYKPGLSIDRINNDGNYCKENCRWADGITQHNNKRTNHLVTFQGKTQTVTQWSLETGIKRHVLYERLNVGCSIDKLFTPVITTNNKPLK